MLAATALLSSALFAATAPPNLGWLEPYRTGVRLVEQGQGALARKSLETALGLRGAGGLRVPAGGVDYGDYLPHLYLAVACQMSGDPDAGRAYLVAAEQEGLAEKSEAGRPLLDAQRVLLRAEFPKPQAKSDGPGAAPRDEIRTAPVGPPSFRQGSRT